jgi:transcription elongation factor GreB
VRSASGLPPGAINYITARGARRINDELARLRQAETRAERVAELEQVLASVTIVNPPEEKPEGATFGATVTVEEPDGATRTYTIVGVDELDFEPDAVSWISPLGKSLLAADLGDRVKVEEQILGKIVKIDYRW